MGLSHHLNLQVRCESCHLIALQRYGCRGWDLGNCSAAVPIRGALGTWLAFLEHDGYPMAWKQLFGSLQGLGLVSREDGHHRDAFEQVSYYVEKQTHCLSKRLPAISRAVTARIYVSPKRICVAGAASNTCTRISRGHNVSTPG